MKDISIVVPSYNRAEFLRQSIPSYLVQDDLLEVIVIDDVSTDDTEAVVNGFIADNPSVVRYFRNDRRLGAAGSKKRGAALAKGGYIAFGEDDVVFDPGYCRVLKSIIESGDADIACGVIHDHNIKDYSSTHAILKCDALERDFIHIPGAPRVHKPFYHLHACALFRRDAYARLDYSTVYRGNYFREESDLYFQAMEKGFRLFVTSDTICHHLAKPKFTDSGCRRVGPLRYYLYQVYNNLVFSLVHRKALREHTGLGVIGFNHRFIKRRFFRGYD